MDPPDILKVDEVEWGTKNLPFLFYVNEGSKRNSTNWFMYVFLFIFIFLC